MTRKTKSKSSGWPTCSSGAEIDEDTLLRARATGVELPEGSDAKYLTKELQSEFIEKQKETLGEIYSGSRKPWIWLTKTFQVGHVWREPKVEAAIT